MFQLIISLRQWSYTAKNTKDTEKPAIQRSIRCIMGSVYASGSNDE